MLRYALRRLRRSPGFTAVAVGTLALGIAANTAIFSVVEAVLLRPLAYRDPDRLISIDHEAKGLKLQGFHAAPFLYLMYREELPAFESVGMWRNDAATITGAGKPERIDVLITTHDLFPTLGVAPALGRGFGEEEIKQGSSPTAIISWGFWQRHFGGASDTLGKRILADGQTTEIIGVMPRGFRVLDNQVDLYLPWKLNRSQVRLGGFGTAVVARLRPGATLATAAAQATRLLPLSLEKFPAPPGFNKSAFERARIVTDFQPLRQSMTGDSSAFLWIVLGTVGILLLIACANVANLLLVRADGRRHELAVRAALGAGSSRIAGDLLEESMILALLGGALGVALAAGALPILPSLAPTNVPRLDEASLDPLALAFALGITLFCGLLFGGLPALRGAGARLAGGLHAGGRAQTETRERNRLRGALVVLQVALALLLTIGAGLMLRTFSALRQVNPGFTNPEQILTFGISVPSTQVASDDTALQMQEDILKRVAAVPGVTVVAAGTAIPMTATGWTDPIIIENRSYAEMAVPPLRKYRFASPGRAAAMGSSFLAGRDFTWEDIHEKRLVTLVTANMAAEVWGSPSAALGKRLRENPTSPWREVIGVVADERSSGLASPEPTAVYFPLLLADFHQNKTWAARDLNVIVRSPRVGTAAFLDDVQRAVWAVNPNMPVADAKTMREIYNRSNARTSFMMVLLALAGGMALLLGIVGVYGVIAYSVARRTREIGIRTALGARPGQLTGRFALQGVTLAGVGVVGGVAAAIPLTKLLQSMLFGVAPSDPLTWAAAATGLLLAAGLASHLPARRVARVHPMEALRAELLLRSQSFGHNRAGFAHNLLQVFRAAIAFRVNLVLGLRARGPRRKPTAARHHLQPARRVLTAVRDLVDDVVAGQFLRGNRVRSQLLERFFLFRSGVIVDPVIRKRPVERRQILVMLARIPCRHGRNLRSQQPHQQTVFVRSPNRSVLPQEACPRAFFPAETHLAVIKPGKPLKPHRSLVQNALMPNHDAVNQRTRHQRLPHRSRCRPVRPVGQQIIDRHRQKMIRIQQPQ